MNEIILSHSIRCKVVTKDLRGNIHLCKMLNIIVTLFIKLNKFNRVNWFNIYCNG